MDHSQGWMTATRSLARICLHCQQPIEKGESYRNVPDRKGWEHRRCFVHSLTLEWPAAKAAQAAQARMVYGVKDEGHEPAHGYGTNFFGTAVEWGWLESKWLPYRVDIARLAYRRRLFDEQIGPASRQALQQVASRLFDRLIKPDELQEICQDVEGEFDLPRGQMSYWLASLGVCLLCRELVPDDDICLKERER